MPKKSEVNLYEAQWKIQILKYSNLNEAQWEIQVLKYSNLFLYETVFH